MFAGGGIRVVHLTIPLEPATQTIQLPPQFACQSGTMSSFVAVGPEIGNDLPLPAQLHADRAGDADVRQQRRQ